MRHRSLPLARRSALLLPLALVLGSRAASAHAHLRHAEPAPGSTIATPPTTVTILFSEGIEPRFTHIEVRNAAGERMDSGPVTTAADDAKTASVPLKPLTPGTYRVDWVAISVDTHKTEGSYDFTLTA